MADDIMCVTFLHPRNGETFDAEIGEATTGKQAIKGLIDADFIKPESGTNRYALQHDKSSKTLPITDPLSAHGVADGDRVHVAQTSSAAGEV